MDTEQRQDTFTVFDVPVETTAEALAATLNEQAEYGLYVTAALEWPGNGMRIVMRRYGGSAHPMKLSREQADIKMVQFIRDNRERTVGEIQMGLKGMGFVRSTAWISQKRTDIIRAERRVK